MTNARPIYLDNHATTRVDPQVVAAMLPYLADDSGNAGSRTHDYGRRAAEAVARAREAVADLLGAGPEDVTFTSGATESNNLAIKGICNADVAPGHVVTSQTEHHAVLDVCRELERRGWEVSYLPARADGRVSAGDVAAAVRANTRLVSIMWANNETGVINDIDGIGAVCRDRGIFFHTDGAQAVGRVPVDMQRSPFDLLSVSGHKIYGPKGVGALVTTRAARRALRPLQQGGGQERGMRPGTLPVHQLVGLGEAARLAAQDLDPSEVARVAGIRDRFLALLRAALPVEVNGSVEHRLPGNLNIWFKGCDTEALAMRCREVAFSTGSACTSESLESSYVITALTGDEQRAAESARFGFGRFTTDECAQRAAAAITRSVLELRALSPRARSERAAPNPSALCDDSIVREPKFWTTTDESR